MSTEQPPGLSHVDAEGRARMVDVSSKGETRRIAEAAATVVFSEGVLERVLRGDLPKGAVLETARIAGVMAGKKTHELIPFCHPLRLSDVDVSWEPAGDRELRLRARVAAVDRTGVEMEALTAVSVAALTVYDMVKAVDRAAVIEGVRVIAKEGGRSGAWRADDGEPRRDG